MIPAHVAAWSLNRDKETEHRVGLSTPTPRLNDSVEEEELESPVLESKGGGNSAPPPPNPVQEARAQIMVLQEQDRLARAANERSVAQAEQDRLAQIDRTATGTEQAYNSALGYGQSQLTSRGLTPGENGVMDFFRSELDRAKSSVPETSQNPGAFFGPDLFQTAYDSALSTKRRGLNNEFDQYAPDAFEYQAFGDSADDQILDAILQQQLGTARGNVDNALARGQLNTSGYNSAIDLLSGQEAGARATLDDLGLGVLQGYRDQLTNSADITRNRIGKFDFGDNFNLDAAGGRLTDTQNRLTGRLEGDIRNTLGNTNLFDTSSLLTQASSGQGAVNPGGGSALFGGVGSSTGDSSEDDDRNTGNTGGF